MKINGTNYISYVNQLYKKNENAGNSGKKEGFGSLRDRIELSDISKDVRKYIEKLNVSETENREKIERIKRAVENGTYQVSPKELAEVIAAKIIDQNTMGEE